MTPQEAISPKPNKPTDWQIWDGDIPPNPEPPPWLDDTPVTSSSTGELPPLEKPYNWIDDLPDPSIKPVDEVVDAVVPDPGASKSSRNLLELGLDWAGKNPGKAWGIGGAVAGLMLIRQQLSGIHADEQIGGINLSNKWHGSDFGSRRKFWNPVSMGVAGSLAVATGFGAMYMHRQAANPDTFEWGRASQFGLAAEYQKGAISEEYNRPMDSRGKAITTAGTRIHEEIQKQFRAKNPNIIEEYAIWDPETKLTGHIDMLMQMNLGGESVYVPTEIKTISSSGLKKLRGPKEGHRAQAQFYMHYLAKEAEAEGRVAAPFEQFIYVSRDDPTQWKMFRLDRSEQEFQFYLSRYRKYQDELEGQGNTPKKLTSHYQVLKDVAKQRVQTNWTSFMNPTESPMTPDQFDAFTSDIMMGRYGGTPKGLKASNNSVYGVIHHEGGQGSQQLGWHSPIPKIVPGLGEDIAGSGFARVFHMLSSRHFDGEGAGTIFSPNFSVRGSARNYLNPGGHMSASVGSPFNMNMYGAGGDTPGVLFSNAGIGDIRYATPFDNMSSGKTKTPYEFADRGAGTFYQNKVDVERLLDSPQMNEIIYKAPTDNPQNFVEGYISRFDDELLDPAYDPTLSDIMSVDHKLAKLIESQGERPVLLAKSLYQSSNPSARLNKAIEEIKAPFTRVLEAAVDQTTITNKWDATKTVQLDTIRRQKILSRLNPAIDRGTWQRKGDLILPSYTNSESAARVIDPIEKELAQFNANPTMDAYKLMLKRSSKILDSENLVTAGGYKNLDIKRALEERALLDTNDWLPAPGGSTPVKTKPISMMNVQERWHAQNPTNPANDSITSPIKKVWDTNVTDIAKNGVQKIRTIGSISRTVPRKLNTMKRSGRTNAKYGPQMPVYKPRLNYNESTQSRISGTVA